jgi:hypothetical protein
MKRLGIFQLIFALPKRNLDFFRYSHLLYEQTLIKLKFVIDATSNSLNTPSVFVVAACDLP